jgi:hypothetical protein
MCPYLDDRKVGTYENRKESIRMRKTVPMLAALIAAIGFAMVACSNSDQTQKGSSAASKSDSGGVKTFCELPAPCQKISQACMPKDDGTPGAVHDCHSTGMEKGVEAACEKDLSSCLATCNAAPGFGGPVEDLYAACRDGGDTTDGGVAVTDSGSPNTRGDGQAFQFPISPLSTFTSDGKDLDIELRTAPDQPIHVGPDGEGQLRITSSGSPVDGLQISVTTWMPVMGHTCSPVPVKVEPQGQGVYLLTPLLASMKGACEIKLTFSGPKSGHAVSPTFDITQ